MKFALALFTLVVLMAGSRSAYGAAPIVILNDVDAANTGFNDPTPVAPVGNNTGTTLGQQRLNAFQFAANIWGATLDSNVTITIRASWEPLSCTSTSATLGSASAMAIFRDFPNAPFAGTWYSSALANALGGVDFDPASPEIRARFNSNLGNAGCSDGTHFYLGLDNNHGSDVDLVAVLMHEFAHGLGFQTFTSSSNGNYNSGFPSVYDQFLLDNSIGKTWVQMTSDERLASAINTGNLVWIGAQTTNDVAGVLRGSPRLRVNAPGLIAGNYTVGTADFGQQLSSPGITANVAQASPTDGCSALTNGGAISGSIALIDRGTCNFVVKVKNAQNAGAAGVIIANNATGTIQMGGSDGSIVIPTVMISQADGNTIKGQLGAGVSATILLDASARSGADGLGHAWLFAPNPVQTGSSVSHWDSSLFPNQLMEPAISRDVTHSVTAPQDLTLSLLRDIGWNAVAPQVSTVQFSAASYSVGEGDQRVNLSVTRSGDTGSAASVGLATSDVAGSQNCNVINGVASSRCDYETSVGTVKFAAGETSKTVSIFIIDDSYPEGTETFTVSLSNPSGASLGPQSTATVAITDNEIANGVNPIDTASFFVRQHYLDFLNREPDSSGLNFWTNEITSCGSNQQCIEIKRINVSAAFYLSIEFQQTGYLVERIYKASYRDANGTSTFGGSHQLSVPVVRLNEFLPDTQEIGQGVIVGQMGWEQVLENNTQAFTAEFVQRSRFTSAFPATMTPAQFVDTLNANAGNPLSQSERDQLVSDLNSGAKTRAQVLRAVAEDPDLSNAEFNRAFVLMQFFGYLRRNPNDPQDSDYTGYDFWLTKLNQFNGNFQNAEMVKAFIVSGEYRQRFGP